MKVDPLSTDVGISDEKLSHRLFALDVISHTSYECWGDVFRLRPKSAHIQDSITERLMALHETQARTIFAMFIQHAKSAVLSSWIFEVMVLRLLNGTHTLRKDLSVLQIMQVRGPQVSSNAVQDSAIALPILLRKVVYTDFKRDSLKATDFSSSLVIPRASNNPLFDAVFVELGQEDVSPRATIWVFQITMLTDYGGSAKGYEDIAEIKRLVNIMLVDAEKDERSTKRRKQRAEVEVRYVFVCPVTEDERMKRTWTMPEGWDVQDDIRGDIYLQLVGTRSK